MITHRDAQIAKIAAWSWIREGSDVELLHSGVPTPAREAHVRGDAVGAEEDLHHARCGSRVDLFACELVGDGVDGLLVAVGTPVARRAV